MLLEQRFDELPRHVVRHELRRLERLVRHGRDVRPFEPLLDRHALIGMAVADALHRVHHDLDGDRAAQISRQFADPEPRDLRSMFSELLFENGLVLRDVIQNLFGLELLRFRRGVRGAEDREARHLQR